MTFLLGLTGGLASGKTTVAALARGAGCLVVDADALVAELYRPGEAGTAAVASCSVAEALTPDGAVDRAAVAAAGVRRPRRRGGGWRRRSPAGAATLPRDRRAAAETVVGPRGDAPGRGGVRAGFDLVVTVEARPEARPARAVARGLTRRRLGGVWWRRAAARRAAPAPTW